MQGDSTTTDTLLKVGTWANSGDYQLDLMWGDLDSEIGYVSGNNVTLVAGGLFYVFRK